MAEFSGAGEDYFPLRDHDLLVKLNVHAENMLSDVSSLKIEVVKQQSDINARLEALRKEIDTKADASAVETLKEFRWMILGAILVLQTLSGIVMFIISQKR